MNPAQLLVNLNRHGHAKILGQEQAPPRGCKTRVGTSTGPVPTLLLQAPRNSNLVKAVHVDTTENLSDFFTKSLDLATLTGIRFQVRKQLMTRNALSSHSRCIPLTLWHSTLAGRMVQPSSSCRLYSARAEVLLSTGGTAMRSRALSVLRGLPTIDC